MKTYTIQIKLEEREHQLLKNAQEKRRLHGLRKLTLENLIKMYMLEGMLQRHFLEQKEARS